MIQFAKYYMIVNLKSVSIIPVFSFTDTDGGHGFFFLTQYLKNRYSICDVLRLVKRHLILQKRLNACQETSG